MKEIIKVKNADYSRYEELLLRRDRLRKEAGILQGLYIREFGDLMLEIFEKQVECIRKKKLIANYQMALNHGGIIDQAEVDRLLKEEMEDYQRQLEEMVAENEAAKKAGEVSTLKLTKIKKIYRRLAKQLHPDINPKTMEIPELFALWNAITTAYNCNNLEDLEEAEVLVGQALERIGLGYSEIEIPDLDQKLLEVEADIRRIRETDPYQYKYLLEDDAAKKDRRRDLEEKKKEYEDYEQELDGVIEDLLQRGVTIVWKKS